ncbi:alkylmercury lyase family protein [Pseudoalteromonas luteoviolacea]|nr:alkylmercury lyase family protein [Pseudoalteromonas luteoviolacea]
MELTHASLHYQIMRYFIEYARAPSVSELSNIFGRQAVCVVEALKALQAYHGVVLQPNTHEIWVAHPFSAAPTNFWIESGDMGWWGNCAWCALGAAALLGRDLTITTTLGSESKQVVIAINNGKIENSNLYVHFPIPMEKAWDNVIYTCSTMLMFKSESDIDRWCERHNMCKGDVQPIEHIWAFSKVWYGRHLNPDWVKWTVKEASEIFESFGLTHSIWKLPIEQGRF